MSEDEFTERSIPHDLEAERGLLGGLLLAPDRFDLVEGRIETTDFFSSGHAALFGAMVDVRKRGLPIDMLVLRDALMQQDQVDLVGGAAGIANLMNAVPTGAHVEHYADIVREKSILRRLIAAATGIVGEATGQEFPANDVLDRAEKSIMTVASQNFTGDLRSIGHVLKDTWEKIDAYQNDHGAVTGIPTDYYELDKMLAGLHEDELIIIAGRPSMGKSTFALNVLRRVAVDHATPAVVFSLEMSAENIARNMLCAQAKIDAQKLRTGRFSENEQTKLLEATDVLQGSPIFIDDTPSISLAEIRGKTR